MGYLCESTSWLGGHGWIRKRPPKFQSFATRLINWEQAPAFCERLVGACGRPLPTYSSRARCSGVSSVQYSVRPNQR